MATVEQSHRQSFTVVTDRQAAFEGMVTMLNERSDDLDARLSDALAQTHGESAASVRERLVAELEGFEVGAQVDDTAVVIMRLEGATRDDRRALRGGQPAVALR